MSEPLSSKHARIRAQQRGIPPLVVDLLLDFGATKHDHRGAEIHYFDRKSKKRLAANCGGQVVGHLGHLLDAYLVVSDAMIVTVGHRQKRIYNP
jgi:hypothetical protein